MIILWLFIILVIILGICTTGRWWIRVYNKFVYWTTRAHKELASIDAIIQKRYDNIHALTQVTKEYNTHEHQTLQDVIDKRASSQSGEYVKALIENYPDLKADELHNSLMLRTSQIEKQLNQARVAYNYSVQRYNESIKAFPQNIVASTHNFEELEYLNFNTETYIPKAIFAN